MPSGLDLAERAGRWRAAAAVFAIVAASASTGCRWILGLGDPVSADAEAAADAFLDAERDAPTDGTLGDTAAPATDAAGDSTAEGAPAADAPSVATDAPGSDGVSADARVEDAPRDREVDAPTVRDASKADGGHVDARPPPDGRAAACLLAPVDAGQACATCVQSLCCSELGACQAPDSTGLDDAGGSACIRLANITLVCTVAVGDPSSGCTQANTYDTTTQTNASALVSCLQQSCALECANYASIPGT